jgi:hypothetical protein
MRCAALAVALAAVLAALLLHMHGVHESEAQALAQALAMARAEDLAQARAQAQDLAQARAQAQAQVGWQQACAYAQVGLVTVAGTDGPLPLYGRRTRRGAERWNYHAVSDQRAPQVLPIFSEGRDCAKPLGCAEVRDGDVIDVRGYGAGTVTMYAR